ncbi:type II secretion system F family protein [Qipengyuania sp. CAU 1752]
MLSGEITRVLVLLAVFVSVYFIGSTLVAMTWENRAHAGAINRRLRLIARGTDREEIISILRRNDPMAEGGMGLFSRMFQNFKRSLMMSAVPYNVSQVGFGMIALFATLLFSISVLIFFSSYSFTTGVMQIVIAFSAAVALGLPLLIISFLAQRRRKKMQSQFPVALDIFVRALRSGHPIASAIDLLTREMEDPIGSEFGLLADEISYGAELTEALEDLADRWDLEDIRMFVVSLSVQNETGGNLAEILDNLSNVIRERASLYLKVRALSSEGRMTGWLLSALPVIAFVSLFSMNPGFYLDVASDPIFYIGFPGLIIWYFVGVFIIRKLINLKV